MNYLLEENLLAHELQWQNSLYFNVNMINANCDSWGTINTEIFQMSF